MRLKSEHRGCAGSVCVTCAAILQRDGKAFSAGHTVDFVVNSPANRVLTAAQAEHGFAAGSIDYHSLDREIDYSAVLPEGLVVIMGKETATPCGHAAHATHAAHAAHAGKTIYRRFTDIWRNVDDAWRVAIRQANVIEVD